MLDLLELLGIRGHRRKKLLDDLAEIARKRRRAIDESGCVTFG